MSKTLDPKNFGDKLYNSLPEIYRSSDKEVNFSLKRYLDSLADGGFEKVIEEINGILTLVDSDKIDEEFLPILFKNYGFDVFNGIPTLYLRKLLPLVSDLYNLKGTTTAVEYLTSLVSGVKSYIELDEEFSNNHIINVNLEMDYGGRFNDMPDQDQLLRIIKEFVPFYCDVLVRYLYIFEEFIKLKVNEEEELKVIENLNLIVGLLANEYEEAVKVKYALGSEVANIVSYSFNNKSISDRLTIKSYNQVDEQFLYTNAIRCYDTIREKGKEPDYIFIITN